MKNVALKMVFGLVIFLFGTALAYFTANYMGTTKMFDYWGTVAIFACVYVIVGMLVAVIFAISLGFLFAADVLILSLLSQYYGAWAAPLKLLVVGAILVILYIVASIRLKDPVYAAAPPAYPSNQVLPQTHAVSGVSAGESEQSGE